MGIARTPSVIFLGTSDSVGVTIASGSTTTSSEIDLGAAESVLVPIFLYLKFTSTVTAGSVDVKLMPYGVTAVAYPDAAQLIGSYAPVNGTQRILVSPVGAFLYVDRFAQLSVFNNGTGANITNVYVSATKFLQS